MSEGKSILRAARTGYMGTILKCGVYLINHPGADGVIQEGKGLFRYFYFFILRELQVLMQYKK